jgi:hypothetical protein
MPRLGRVLPLLRVLLTALLALLLPLLGLLGLSLPGAAFVLLHGHVCVAAGSNVIGGVRGGGLVGRVGRRISVVGSVLWVASTVVLRLVRATAAGLAGVCL